MRVVTYCRVSGASQVDGFGIPNQGDAIARFCALADLTVVSSHVDVVSGTAPIEERTGLTDALRVIRNMDAEGLVVARMDRLARKLTVQEAILAQVWKYRGTVFTADTGEVRKDDPSDPMLTAMRQMIGVFAELDRAMTVGRLTAGKAAKRAAGGYVGGSVPYGYRRDDDDQLVPVPEEQHAIRLMRDLHAHGHSLRVIALMLGRQGIRNRSGATFDAKAISRVLTRPE